ncbi:MAG: hypothetical protein IPH66_07715 [Crocinitomicaceae bacterium]|nr:hypothetical protein [Crocinitomicaceae bacterium]
MRIRLLFYLTLLVCASGSVLAQSQNIWTKKANFGGLKRERAVSFSIDNYGYVATGEDTVNMTHNDLWRYDPELDVWTQMADLPGSTRRNAVGFALEGRGYVGTGMDSSESSMGNPLNDFWQYDPLANSWIQKANYPGAGGWGVYYAGSFTADGKGYVTCGKYGPSAYAFDLWEYKPTTDTWTQRANFPGGVRYAVTALSIENKGYVGMGIDQDLYRKDWWEYDPASNIWTEKTDIPGTERGAASTFTLGSKGFIVFGGDGGFKDELWEYNPFSDSWNIRSNFPGGERRNGIAMAIGNKGYAGIGKGPSGIRQNFYEYSPILPLETSDFEMIHVDVYPNPASEYVQVFIQNEMYKGRLVIISQKGELVKSILVDSQTYTFSSADFDSATYYIILIDCENNLVAKSSFTFI